MIKCYALTDEKEKTFRKLFADYYQELGCEDDTEHLLDEYVLPDCLAGLISIDLLDEDGGTVGFVIYQIDGIENEWCLKEDLGDIREIYITPSSRRRGLGKFMLYTAEMKLRERGATTAYTLPYEGAVPFFTACGYADSGEYCDELDCNVYVKESLLNKCSSPRHCEE